MSNSKPSAMVLQGIACIGGLYIKFDSNGEIGSVFAQEGISPTVARAIEQPGEIEELPAGTRTM